MESRLPEIREAQGEVLGLSADSPFSLAKWAAQEGYTFTLLSDFGKSTCAAYGILYESLAGLSGVPKRAAFLIDKQGTLVQQEVLEDAGQIPDLNGFLEHLKRLA